MNGITEKLLGIVSDWAGSFNGAFNIRENGQCAGRQSTAHIKIESKTDVPGLDIRILPGTKGESVSIPACVTHGDVDDLVYNDFFVGDGADVTIVAGCGVHTDDGEPPPPQRNPPVFSGTGRSRRVSGKAYRYGRRQRQTQH